MRTFNMTDRIAILRPVKTSNRFGEEKTEYEQTCEVWAERERMSGRTSEEVAEHFATYAVRWNIRYGHKVEESWHVRHVGGYEYIVQAIEPNIHRGYKTLVCERLNP